MKKLLLVILITLLLGYIFLSFIYAINGYPGFFQDAVCFLPTTYFINHYHQLINPLYDAGLDPIKHRFLFYPPLFPYVIAWILKLMPEFTNNISVALTILDTISVLLLTYCIYLYSKKQGINPTVKIYVCLIAWFLALFSFYGITDGRPEILCRFFITCFLLNNIIRPTKTHNFIDGLLIGLNMITSPISTFYLILIKLGIIIYEKEFKIRTIIQTIIGFVILLIVFTILYPYHLSELINTMQQHSKNVILNRIEDAPFSHFLSVYIFSPYNPLSILTVFSAITYAFYHLIKRRKLVCLAVFCTLLILISYFSFRNIFLVYNLMVLSPFYFFLIFLIFTEDQILIDKKILKRLSIITVLLLLINSIGYIRKGLLFFATKKSNFSSLEFRNDLLKVVNTSNKNIKVEITSSLWPYCLDKYQNIIVTPRPISELNVDYIIVQQLYSGKSSPESIEGYDIVDSKFITEHPKLGKLTLGNVVPWFQVAVYKRKAILH